MFISYYDLGENNLINKNVIVYLLNLGSSMR